MPSPLDKLSYRDPLYADNFGVQTGMQDQDAYRQYKDDFLVKEQSNARRAVLQDRLNKRGDLLRMSPFQQLRMAGMLGNRGLGYSYTHGGAGSAQAKELLNEQARALGDVDTAAQGQLSEMSRNYRKDLAENDARKAKWTDYVGGATGLLTSFL